MRAFQALPEDKSTTLWLESSMDPDSIRAPTHAYSRHNMRSQASGFTDEADVIQSTLATTAADSAVDSAQTNHSTPAAIAAAFNITDLSTSLGVPSLGVRSAASPPAHCSARSLESSSRSSSRNAHSSSARRSRSAHYLENSGGSSSLSSVPRDHRIPTPAIYDERASGAGPPHAPRSPRGSSADTAATVAAAAAAATTPALHTDAPAFDPHRSGSIVVEPSRTETNRVGSTRSESWSMDAPAFSPAPTDAAAAAAAAAAAEAAAAAAVAAAAPTCLPAGRAGPGHRGSDWSWEAAGGPGPDDPFRSDWSNGWGPAGRRAGGPGS
jgi:hypothetical protein